jgi:hypothetical protein
LEFAPSAPSRYEGRTTRAPRPSRSRSSLVGCRKCRLRFGPLLRLHKLQQDLNYRVLQLDSAGRIQCKIWHHMGLPR